MWAFLANLCWLPWDILNFNCPVGELIKGLQLWCINWHRHYYSFGKVMCFWTRNNELSLHSKVSFIYLTLTQLSVISLTTPPIKSVMYSLVFVSACVWILIQDDKWTNLACMNRTEDWLCAQWGMCKPQHLQMSSLDPSEFCWGPWSFKM